MGRGIIFIHLSRKHKDAKLTDPPSNRTAPAAPPAAFKLTIHTHTAVQWLGMRTHKRCDTFASSSSAGWLRDLVFQAIFTEASRRQAKEQRGFVASFYFVHKKGAVVRLLMSSFMANYEKNAVRMRLFY